MKKNITSILIGIMVLVMLSGCGNDIEETPLSNSIPLTDDMTYITYQIKADNIDSELKSSAESILRMRLDSMGYTETTIQLEENNQISVILPAEIKIDEERAEFLAATPKLTFKDYKGNVLLTGQDIKQVNVEHGSLSDSGEEEYYLLLEFNKEGKSKFEEATTQISILSEPNNYIAISLDEMTISAPRVTESIKSGSCVINGNFDENSINELADNIRSALLSFSLEIVKINNSTTPTQSPSATSTPNNTPTPKPNSQQYYSCLTKDGNGLKFNVTPQEFLNRYNSLKSSYEDSNYKDIELSDFFYIEDGTSINGTSGEAYGCSQTIMGEFSDLVICIQQEKNGNGILSVSFGIKNNKYSGMYYSDKMVPKIMTQYELLICAITGCDMATATNYTVKLLENDTKSTYDRGIVFYNDTSNSVAHWYRITPCTREQYDNAF